MDFLKKHIVSVLILTFAFSGTVFAAISSPVYKNGNDYIVGTNAPLGEMYMTANAVESSIEAVDQWHGGGGQTAGALDGWTFESGGVYDISAFADYSATVAGTIKATTTASHGLTTGDPVSLVGANIEIEGSNEYAGVYSVTVIDADEFYFTNADWNATTTAKVISPDTLIAGVYAAGTYMFSGSVTATSAGTNKVYDFSLFVNEAASSSVTTRLGAKSASEYSSTTGIGVQDIVVGDQIWFAVKGSTDATNITMFSTGTVLHKL